MADDIKGSSIVEEVNWLRNDSIGSLVRDDMRLRWRLINLDHDAEMTPHETRGGPVYVVNSPRVLELKRTLQATMATYETETRVVPWTPQGGDAEHYKRMAEAVEPFYVLSRAKLDNGGRVSHKVRGHLLGSSYVTAIMDFAPAGSSAFPFSIRIPPPDTTYVPEQSDYPCVPPIMGMEYEMLVRDIVSQYSDQARTDFAAKKLYLDKSSGKFDWHGIGAERPTDGWDGTGAVNSLNGRYLKATIKVLYADGWCYHVAMNVGSDGKSGEEGQIIWKYPSMTGGVPAFIMSGNVGETVGRKHLLPGLYAPIQTTNTRNAINTVRFTRSRNLKPDVFIEWPPEVWESVKNQGWAREATQAEIEAGGPHIMQGPGGVPHFWQVPKDEDLKEIEASVIAEEHEYIQQIQAITNHETAERATAQGLRLVSGNVEDQHTEWLNSLAMMWTEFHYMQEIAMTGHDPRLWVDAQTEQKILIAKPGRPYLSSEGMTSKEAMNLHASIGMKYSGGELVAGKSYTITEESLNFGHEIKTTISSETAAKKREALEDAVRRRDVYGAPVDEMLETQGYADIAVVKRSMAKEEAYGAAGQGMMGIPVLALDKALQLSGGVNISALKGILAPQPEVAPGGAPPGAGAQQDPATRGAGGTSSTAPGGPG